MKPAPPRLAEWLLTFFLRGDLAEEVLGDLDEKFYATAEGKTLYKAKRNYWFQVINYLRPFAIKKSSLRNSINNSMYKNYLKVGYRNLLRNKGYSSINIMGLAVGMAHPRPSPTEPRRSLRPVHRVGLWDRSRSMPSC